MLKIIFLPAEEVALENENDSASQRTALHSDVSISETATENADSGSMNDNDNISPEAELVEKIG